MSLVSTITNTAIHQVPWGTIGQYIAASGVLSALLIAPYKYIKKWFVNHSAVMSLVTVVLGMGAALVHYVMTDPAYAPGIAVLQGFSLTAGAKIFYDVVLKPLLTPIAKNVWGGIMSQFSQAKELADVKSATIPTDFTQ